VFPIYRTLQMPFPLRFAFVENEPLQLLIDCGWFFTALIAAASALVAWQIIRRGRRDKIEAALVAGLFAVLVHNTVDFGLETLGILLPFMAVLGAVLGRLPAEQGIGDTLGSSRRSWILVTAASGGALFGMISIASPSSDDFDALLRKTTPPAAHRALLTRAQKTHPLDYFYALEDARTEPLKGPAGSLSPRLHALNRALQLCRSCDAVHAEVARNLWLLRLRRQALLEWRTAVEIRPALFMTAVGELSAQGANAQELAAVASGKGDLLLELVAFLSGRRRLDEALKVLDQADSVGAPRPRLLLARANLQIQSGQLQQAAATLDAARAAGVNDDAGMLSLSARLVLASKGADGADEALALLDRAASRFPSDVVIQRQRIDLVTTYQKWNAASRALEGLKQALYQIGASTAEAHIASARMAVRFGHWTEALGEYRIALVDYATNVTYWVEYAQAAETAGRVDVARDAYRQALRLSPQSPDLAAALHALDERQDRLRAMLGDGMVTGAATAPKAP